MLSTASLISLRLAFSLAIARSLTRLSLGRTQEGTFTSMLLSVSIWTTAGLVRAAIWRGVRDCCAAAGDAAGKKASKKSANTAQSEASRPGRAAWKVSRRLVAVRHHCLGVRDSFE